MRFAIALLMALLAAPLAAQSSADEAALRRIVEEENETWNRGDAVGYSRHFASDGVFTNIRGERFVGYEAFLRQHDAIFNGIFRGSTLRQDIVSVHFLNPDVATIETLTAVGDFVQLPPGATPDSEGRLRTRLLQVLHRQEGEWKIVFYHNVDVKPGVPLPEG